MSELNCSFNLIMRVFNLLCSAFIVTDQYEFLRDIQTWFHRIQLFLIIKVDKSKLLIYRALI